MPLTKVTFEQVERELRKRTFGILSTVSKNGRSHSTGIMYGASSPEETLEIYVMIRMKSKKFHNIVANPNIIFVVPLLGQFLTFIPHNCIPFQGTAEIVEAENGVTIQTFRMSYVGRMILNFSSDVETLVFTVKSVLSELS